MGIKEWLGFSDAHEATPDAEPEVRAEEDPTPPVIPSRLISPSAVTAGDALGLSAVYRAVSLKATAMRQLSIDVFNGQGNAQGLPLWLRKPGVNLSWRAFVEQTTVSLNLTGNAYWRVRRFDDSGKVESLEVLNPHDVLIDTSETGRVTGYQHRGFKLGVDDIKHLSALRVPGSPYGLGPIQAAQAELRGALDTNEYSSNWLADNDVPSGVLSSDVALTDKAAKDAKDAWKNSHGGTYDVAVLGSGLKYSPVFLDPESAQWLESRQYSAVEIARMFGVPLSLMMAALSGSSLTYTNLQDELRAWVRFGLPEIGEIEDALTDLLPRTQTARFNTEGFLRLDTAARYAAHAQGIAAGWLRPSEVRDIEGLPEIEGIDALPASTPNEETA